MDSSSDKPPDTPLNPALKSRTETVYDTKSTTPAPIDTASATEGEGEGWPMIWLVITVICIAVTLYLIL
jgi:hypothetical protein